MALRNTVAIPCVMGSVEGTMTFYHYEGPGCSSALHRNEDADLGLVQAVCNRIDRIEHVCSISLARIIDLIPEHLDIELVKVDGQGLDLDVVKSAGTRLHKVGKFIIEAQDVVDEGRNMLSKAAVTRQAAIAWFNKNGYEIDLKRSYLENEAIREWNLAFDRT